MKLISAIISILLLITTCKAKIKFNQAFFDKKISADKGVIISCVKCDCVDETLNKARMKGELGKTFQVYADPKCTTDLQGIPTIDISAQTLDSMSREFFNIVLFRRTKTGSVDFRILETKEMTDFDSIATLFFK